MTHCKIMIITIIKNVIEHIVSCEHNNFNSTNIISHDNRGKQASMCSVDKYMN